VVLCVVEGGLTLDEVWEDMTVEIFGGNSEVPVEEEEELFLHQVDFGKGE
jgi:hypothetical protein